ncbi:M14 family metallopeptidase [Gemmatimonadota bacterium DH-20]|uniref:M14 family metallopeptidase n=1 Tax=Gaopeijia maritima TaxID=3119007 RepID=A0ABU9EEB2_9BACT
MRHSLLLIAGLAVAAPLHAQRTLDATTLPTRAEATGWVETSRYADVMEFLQVVAERRSDAHLISMGYTSEGRSIPMLVVGADDPSPEGVRASGKLRVYLQGNIHAGEVPGKEALQMLVRDIASGTAPESWTDDLVLLVVPMYNVDGNERVRLTNRPRQHGPIGGMGQRPNAMDLDLNRDHMKLDSPEARSVVGMMNRYDPHVSVDLHTTNGTQHGYHLTYSPPLHPAAPAAVVDLLRNTAFPRITNAVRDAHGWEMYYYGNARSLPNGETGWYTFDHRPRFNNNYVGLRNRFAILSEAYSYATFEDRVKATRWFVDEILNWAVDDADAIRSAVEAADASVVGATLPTRATFEAADTLSTILMGETVEEPNPWSGQTMLRRTDVTIPTQMREYGTFTATHTEVAPLRYYLPAEVAPALDRLAFHGVVTTVLESERTVSVESFRIDSTSVAPRPFQGHNEVELFGEWVPGQQTLPAGTVQVEVAQPLGRLAFYLLEPRSDDGLANWALLDRWTSEGTYPILREPAH